MITYQQISLYSACTHDNLPLMEAIVSKSQPLRCQKTCQKIRGFLACLLFGRGMTNKLNETTKTTVLLHRDLLPQKLIDHLVYLKLDHHYDNRIKKLSFGAATKIIVGGSSSVVSTVHQDAYNKFYRDQVGKYYSTTCILSVSLSRATEYQGKF